MAAGNKSTLEVEVISKGIADTVKKLDSLGYAADRNEKKVVKLTDSLKNLMTMQESAVGKAVQHSNLMSAIADAMNRVSQAANASAKQVEALTRHMGTLATETDRVTHGFDRKVRSGGVVNTTLRAMATAASAYLSIGMAKSIVESADGWAMMQAKLKLATGSMQEARNVQADLFQMAQKLRVPLEDAAKLYTRMAAPMQRMGKTSQETAEQVEFVSLALKLGGATAAEASSVMLQYSQAVNAGRLNGAEFNAVSEASPGILRAIEAELKATSDWSEHSGKSLKKMGADGEITFDLMRRAAVRALPQMRKDFEELPLTVDGAIQRVKNAWFKAMGEMGEDTGLSRKLAQAIAVLEQNIPVIRDSLASIFIFLTNNFGMVTSAIQIMIGLKLVSWAAEGAKALSGMAAGAATLAGGLSTVAGGTGKAAGAVGLLGRAAGLLAGPWGTMISLVGTGAVLAYQAFSREAPKAEAAVTEATRSGTEDRITMIQKEIDKLNELNGVKKATAPAADPNAVPTKIMEQRVALSKLVAKANGETDATVKAGMQVTINARQIELQREEALWASYKALRAVTEAKENDNKVTALTTSTMVEYANQAEKANAAVKKKRDEYAELGKTLPAEIEKRIRDSFKTAGGDAKAQANYYQTLRENITATSKELALQAKMTDKLTESEKLKIKLKEDDKFNKLSGDQKKGVLAVVDNNISLEKEAQAAKATQKAIEELDKEREKRASTAQSELDRTQDAIDKTRDEIDALGENKTVKRELQAQRIEDAALEAELNAFKAEAIYFDEKAVEIYTRQAEKLRELAGLKREQGVGEDKKIADDAFEKLLNPERAKTFGDALSSAFGQSGEALTKMTKGLDQFFDRERDIGKVREKLLATEDSEERTQKLLKLDKLETKSKIRAAGDMVGAAKGFFKEHSKGYKALEATEKAFRAFELAQTLQNNAVKLEGVWTYIAAKGQELWAMWTGVAVDATTTQTHVALSGEKAVASTVAGTAKAFEQMGVYGFIGAAAIIAFMASMGVSGGGSGSAPSLSEERQKKQGTGTVLGDEDAKSESLSKSLELLEDHADISLKYTSGMLNALQNIDAGISSMATFVAQSVGLRGTRADEKMYDIGVTRGGGMFGSGIFGSKTTRTMQDSGILFGGGQTIGSILGSGVSASGYTDVEVTKKKWYGSSKTRNERHLNALNESLLEQIQLTVGDLSNGIVAAGEALGKSGEEVRRQLATVGVNIGEISLKGLSGDEIAAELEAVFGALGDNMAKAVLGGFEDFQVVGEGYFQTAIRVASGVEVATAALDQLNIDAIGVHAIARKHGDVAMELVRDSLKVAEAGSSIAPLLDGITGSMSDLVDTYKALVDIRSTMGAAGLGTNLSRDLLRGAGGLDNLQSSMEDFIEGFYTDGEKSAISMSKLTAEFGKLTGTVPRSRTEFRELVQTLMLGGAASQEMAGRVLQLAGAFDELQEMLEENVTEARDALSEAYEREADALEDTKTKFLDFAKSLREFQNSLQTGSLSPMTQAQKYAELQNRYQNTTSLARMGDKDAIGKFKDIANEFLSLSQQYNASGANYLADYASVMNDTAYLATVAESQADVATQQLEALEKQVAGLIELKDSVLTVAQAIEKLHAAMAQAGMASPVDGSHANGLSYVPFDGYRAELHKGEAVLTAAENRALQSGSTGRKSDDALANELSALRQEVAAFRKESAEQTGALIGATYDANERNAERIVEGTEEAVDKNVWKGESKVKMV